MSGMGLWFKYNTEIHWEIFDSYGPRKNILEKENQVKKTLRQVHAVSFEA